MIALVVVVTKVDAVYFFYYFPLTRGNFSLASSHCCRTQHDTHTHTWHGRSSNPTQNLHIHSIPYSVPPHHRQFTTRVLLFHPSPCLSILQLPNFTSRIISVEGWEVPLSSSWNLHIAHTPTSRGLTNVGCRKRVFIRVQKIVPPPVRGSTQRNGIGGNGQFNFPALSHVVKEGRRRGWLTCTGTSLCSRDALGVGILQIRLFWFYPLTLLAYVISLISVRSRCCVVITDS
jgi:hypothetical protein